MVETNIHLANLSDVFKSGIHLERSKKKNLSTTWNLAESNHFLMKITFFWDRFNSLL